MTKNTTFYLFITLILFPLIFIQCKNSNSSNTNTPTITSQSDVRYLFLVDPNCEEQMKGVQLEEKVKLILFDAKGISNKKFIHNGALVKRTLTQDSEFKEMAKNNFDFIAVSQECKLGRDLALKHKVVKFPVAMLLDKDMKEIFQIRVVNHIDEIMMEDQKDPVMNIDILKSFIKVKLKKINKK